MKCPDCNELMVSDCELMKYVCECGDKVMWSKEYCEGEEDDYC